MKVKLWTIFLILGLSLSWWVGLGHDNKHGVATLDVKGGTLTIDYGRPAAQGRDLFSMIQPGSYWRLGADGTTTLTTDVALLLGEQKVAKGQYTLVAHFAGQEDWSLVVAAADAGRKPAPEQIVAKASSSLSQLDSPVEFLTIKLEGRGNEVQLIVEWGQKRLTTQFHIA